MNVVVCSTSWPRNRDDHCGRFVRDLSVALTRRGHRLVHVVPGTPEGPEREDDSCGLVIRARYAPRSWQKLAYGDGITSNLRRAPWLALLIPSLIRSLVHGTGEAIRAHGADAVIAHWIYPTALHVNPLARGAGIPCLGIEHGGGAQLLGRLPFGARSLRRYARHVDHTLFVSEDLRGKAARILGGPGSPWPGASTVHPMGCDLERFAPVGNREATRQDWSGGSTRMHVLAVGRLIGLKGFDLLLRAAESRDIVVGIAGDGPERRTLEVLARPLGDRIRFFGHMGTDRLRDLYEAADVVCVPSRLGPGGRSEGSPVVVAEAFAAGRPVIASRTGGLPDAIEDAGALFDAEDVQGLGHRLDELADRLEEFSAAALARAPRFSSEAVAAVVESALAGAATELEPVS